MGDCARLEIAEFRRRIHGEIIDRRIVGTNSTGAQQRIVKIETEHTAKQVFLHERSKRQRGPIDFGSVERGIKETTPVFQRQSRHAQTIILAISYAEAMQMHAKSFICINQGNQLGRSRNARAF